MPQSVEGGPVKDEPLALTTPGEITSTMSVWKGKKASKRTLDSRETMREKARKPYTSSKIEVNSFRFGVGKWPAVL